MATKSSVPQKIQKIYEPTDSKLAGADQIKEFLGSFKKLVENSGFKPRSKEMQIYKEVLDELGRCVGLLERNEVDDYDFTSEEAIKLKDAAIRYLIDNQELDKPGCVLCANFVQTVEKELSKPKFKTKPTKADTSEEDAVILEKVLEATGVPASGVNKKIIMELLHKAFEDTAITTVRVNQKGDKQVPSIFIDNKAITLLNAANASIRALKLAIDDPNSKYVKDSYVFKLKSVN